MDRPAYSGYARHMRALLALLLSLILALGSQAEAVARSEMAGATDQTLCGASGASRVTLDATGHRISLHPCTHCVSASVMADLASPIGLATAPIRRTYRVALAQTAQTPVPQAFVPLARAPPVILV